MVLAGCGTLLDPALTPEEREVLEFSLDGVKIGDRPGVLAKFPQVQRVPVKLDGLDVYEVFNPSPQISAVIASFHQDGLRKLEIRYFNGPGTRTLSRAGGWEGIRDYLIEKFGPPSRFGADAPIVASQPGLKVEYAKFNGEWIFSRVRRQVNFIAMADAAGGVGVVTVMDTTPIPPPPPLIGSGPAAPVTRVPMAAEPSGPNPGF